MPSLPTTCSLQTSRISSSPAIETVAPSGELQYSYRFCSVVLLDGCVLGKGLAGMRGISLGEGLAVRDGRGSSCSLTSGGHMMKLAFLLGVGERVFDGDALGVVNVLDVEVVDEVGEVVGVEEEEEEVDEENEVEDVGDAVEDWEIDKKGEGGMGN